MKQTKLRTVRRFVVVLAALALVVFGVAACMRPVAPLGAQPAGSTESTTTDAAPVAASAAVTETGAAAATEAAAEAGAATETADAAETPALQPITEVVTATEEFNGVPVGFTADGAPFRGDPNAPIVMLEYSDFQCPFCSRYFVQTEPAINESYVRTGQLRVVFRDFPIEELHPNAPAAHVAATCIAEQGAAKYWDMHGKLFQTQSQWSDVADPTTFFADLAKQVGADMDTYTACVADPAAKEEFIATAIAEGQAAGVSGTPSFQFVNPVGERFLLVGAQPYDQFAAYIDALVAGDKPPVAAEEQQPQGDAEIPLWATAEGWAPDPERPGYNMAGDEYRGSPDAKVVVVEFSDYQCPFCRQHSLETQPTLDKEFVDSGKVMWVFKHFPLSIHPQAPAAGAAAECAAEQGKFGEMSEALFDKQSDWSVEDPNPKFVAIAKELGLDEDAFATCLQDTAIADRVQSDMSDGAPYVQGTPTFIVLFNGEGRIIPGAIPVDRFTTALQEIVDQAQ